MIIAVGAGEEAMEAGEGDRAGAAAASAGWGDYGESHGERSPRASGVRPPAPLEVKSKS